MIHLLYVVIFGHTGYLPLFFATAETGSQSFASKSITVGFQLRMLIVGIRHSKIQPSWVSVGRIQTAGPGPGVGYNLFHAFLVMYGFCPVLA